MGSFKCSCNIGYELHSDGKKCEGKKDSIVNIVVAVIVTNVVVIAIIISHPELKIRQEVLDWSAYHVAAALKAWYLSCY